MSPGTGARCRSRGPRGRRMGGDRRPLPAARDGGGGPPTVARDGDRGALPGGARRRCGGAPGAARWATGKGARCRSRGPRERRTGGDRRPLPAARDGGGGPPTVARDGDRGALPGGARRKCGGAPEAARWATGKEAGRAPAVGRTTATRLGRNRGREPGEWGRGGAVRVRCRDKKVFTVGKVVLNSYSANT